MCNIYKEIKAKTEHYHIHFIRIQNKTSVKFCRDFYLNNKSSLGKFCVNAFDLFLKAYFYLRSERQQLIFAVKIDVKIITIFLD